MVTRHTTVAASILLTSAMALSCSDGKAPRSYRAAQVPLKLQTKHPFGRAFEAILAFHEANDRWPRSKDELAGFAGESEAALDLSGFKVLRMLPRYDGSTDVTFSFADRSLIKRGSAFLSGQRNAIESVTFDPTPEVSVIVPPGGLPPRIDMGPLEGVPRRYRLEE